MAGYGSKLYNALYMPSYVRCVCFASLAAYVYGFDTGSIGPITVMTDFEATFGKLSATVQGLFVSSILIPAAIISFGSGSIADRISRTHAVSLGCAVYGTGSLISLLAGLNMSQASSLAMVFIGRCISGAGEGIFLSAVTVYGIEVAPQDQRGRVGCIMQLFICIGIMTGYFVCYGSLNIAGSLSWRLPWILQCMTCIVTAIGVRFLPHSPRWLLHVGRRAEAEVAIQRLGLSKEEFVSMAMSEEDEAAHAAAAQERTQRGGWRHHVEQFKEAFAPGLRGRTSLALFMLAVQQLGGIDGVLYYSPVLFQQAGLSSQSASFLASGVTGIVNVVFTLVGQSISDKWGRRTALIWGGIVMATAMTTIGSLYSVPGLSQAGNYTVIAFIFIYFIAFIMTWAILMRIWVSEAQPVQTRASVSSLALTTNWGCNWVVAFTTPMFLDAYPNGPYFLWAACTWVSVGVFLLWLPETRGQNVDLAGQDSGLKLQVQIPGMPRRDTGLSTAPTLVEKEETKEKTDKARTAEKVEEVV
ncbi:general substrate transporter [Schizophyllum commune]